MGFTTLYKKNSNGSIQYWNISVTEQQGAMTETDIGPMQGVITTRYGQVGTENEQITHDFIAKGKNPGKKNETTAYQQALKEAQSSWTKQKKKGYVESIEAAQAGELDDLIEGGIVPMLAHKFSEHAHKILYPAFVQPKLDGIRCIAIVKDGEATLWSRTRKQITSCPHIVQELEAAFANMDIVLDGELYNHSMKSEFEKIVSLVRQEEPGEGFENIEYHVYDMASDQPFKNRYAQLHRLFNAFGFQSMVLVKTEICKAEDNVMEFFDKYRAEGYEGAMVRNVDSMYVNKRSYDLLKVKEFDDAEFQIVGIEEGRGKLAGSAIFVCKDDKGAEFKVKAKGATENLKRYFEDKSLWEGKKLTVQYQGLTGKEKVPRFPVGIAVRDYE